MQLYVPRGGLGAFYRGLGAWLEGDGFSAERAVDAGELVAVSVEVDSEQAAQLYAAYGEWLDGNDGSGRHEGSPEQPQLEPAEADQLWRNLASPRERELLLLLDDAGGAVPWRHLHARLGLPRDLDPRRDLPELHAWCERRERAVPVRVYGGGDPSLRLSEHLVGRFSALQRLTDEPADDEEPTPRGRDDDVTALSWS